METTCTCDDCLVRWLVDIDRCARFCDNFDGLVDDTNIVSEPDYMAWCLNTTQHPSRITITRISVTIHIEECIHVDDIS